MELLSGIWLEYELVQKVKDVFSPVTVTLLAMAKLFGLAVCTYLVSSEQQLGVVRVLVEQLRGP